MLYRRLTCMLRFRIHIISLVSQTKLIFFFAETYYWLFRGGGLVKVGGMSFKIMIHDSPGRLSSIESLNYHLLLRVQLLSRLIGNRCTYVTCNDAGTVELHVRCWKV